MSKKALLWGLIASQNELHRLKVFHRLKVVSNKKQPRSDVSIHKNISCWTTSAFAASVLQKKKKGENLCTEKNNFLQKFAKACFLLLLLVLIHGKLKYNK